MSDKSTETGWEIALAYARASDTQPLDYRLRDLGRACLHGVYRLSEVHILV